MNKELRFHLATRFNSAAEIKRLTYGTKKNNELIYRETETQLSKKRNASRFILTHLMIPHYPYYYDSLGNERAFADIVEGQQVNKDAYISYLKWGNKKYLALIDSIIAASKTTPIIIFAGDHGFRHFNEQVDKNYYFNNQVSILWPGKNYSRVPDSLANVNLLRMVLNEQFAQRLPFEKNNQTIYLND